MMMALNHQLSDGSQEFEENPATFAFQKGMGVITMKVIRLALQPFYRGKHLSWMQPAYRDGWEKGLRNA